MADTFSSIGKQEALRRLYELSAYPMQDRLSFVPEGGGRVVTAGKAYMEGIDFSLVYFPLRHLGYKCVVGVTGELFASLAQPATLGVTLGIPGRMDMAQVEQLWSGIAVAAQELGYPSVRLELRPSCNGLLVSLSASGLVSAQNAAAPEAALSRDLICVSGALGSSYLAMQLLEKGAREVKGGAAEPDLSAYKMILGNYLRPELEAGLPGRFAQSGIRPSHGYFVSEGLSDVLLRLRRDSGLGVKVYADKIPFEGNSFQLGKELDIDPVSAAMNGGEDARLVYVIPILQWEAFHREFPRFDVVGHMARPEVGAVLVTPEGVEFPVRAQGWPEEA